MKNSNYKKLIKNLDAFIRKYYLNQALRGGLYWLATALVMYLVFSLLESQFWFSSGVRKLMFFSFIGIALGSFIFLVGKPLLSYFKLGNRISNEKAAEIVGNHFTSVKDKLLNVLQLNEQVQGTQDSSLLIASIEQKTSDIRVVRFPDAVDLSQNRKYLKYVAPPLAILLVLLFAAPTLLTDSTNRLIRNNEEFEKPAPFTFSVNQDKLNVVQYSDVEIDVEVDGDVIPNDAYISFGQYEYKLKKADVGKFTYNLKNVQESQQFTLKSGNVTSKPYSIDVIGKPGIESYSLSLDYPAYTGRSDESLDNVTDLIVPAGTKIQWKLNTMNTEMVQISHPDSMQNISAAPNNPNRYTAEKRVYKNENLSFLVSGNGISRADSIQFSLLSIPDKYPQIRVKKFQDSTNNEFIFFAGEASDDYGLRNLYFKYRIESEDGEKSELKRRKVPINNSLSTSYDYEWDVSELELKPGDKVSYYFEVFDNDAINGSKSSRTSVMSLSKPSLEEYEQREEENDQAILEQLDKSFKESSELKKELEKLKNKMMTKKKLDWKDKKELEKLMKKRDEIKKRMKEAQKKFQENLDNQKEMKQPSEETQEKQEKLDEMFKKMEEKSEIDKMLEKIQELMQDMDKEESLETMEKMEQEQKQQELDLDRLKELYKQLELETEVQKQMDKLNELSEKQEKLAEETEKKSKPQEELMKEQEEINKEFEKINKQVDEIEKKNQKLTKPQDLGNPQKKMHNIEDDLKKGSEELKNNNNKKASEKQKDAAKKMKQMEQEMSSSMSGGQQQQMQEDIKMLRQLLENLVTISFDQEKLMEKAQRTDPFTQNYVRNTQEQFKLQDDFTVVEDSLRALSKRVFQLEAFIMEKVLDINSNFESTMTHLEERQVGQARADQQKVMTNVNDLAVMLSETMEQMQMQMSSNMPGSQMCNKPGMGKKPKPGQTGKGGKKPMDKITEGQKKLTEEMKKMAQENGKKGKSGKDGEGGSSEEFAKMAQEQAKLRQMLRDHQKSLQEQGQGNKALEEILKQMNQNETQLVNKRLTNEMLKRQEEIMTRLLESERAERQRKMDEKRKAETAKAEQKKKMPPELEKYLESRESEIEGLRSVSPSLLPFYKNLVEEYYNSIGTK